MHTYRSGDNWDSEDWPEMNENNRDITRWHYQESTGLLTAKEDATGKSVTYTYREGGRLYTRTWARTDGQNPLLTIYDYDNLTGELTGIDYSDATPDITFTYTRLGRKDKVKDVTTPEAES